MDVWRDAAVDAGVEVRVGDRGPCARTGGELEIDVRVEVAFVGVRCLAAREMSWLSQLESLTASLRI